LASSRYGRTRSVCVSPPSVASAPTAAARTSGFVAEHPLDARTPFRGHLARRRRQRRQRRPHLRRLSRAAAA
jgi:hypothetical protein